MSAFLELKNVSYSYDPQAKEPRWAVKDVSLSIEEGEFIALIGHTGSGKSTLIQFFDGLLAPTEGQVLFQGQDTREKGFSMKTLRQNVGLVFQYPEHQLFEMTLLKDVCYGPKNLKLPKEEQEARAKEALRLVGFTENDFDRSPFDLSGGRKRRAAIAGVLAMKPRMLILDEPAAGLDPKGRTDLLEMLTKLNRENHTTILMVTHSMEDAARYAGRVLAMNKGKLVADGPTREVFTHFDELQESGLSVPEPAIALRAMKERGIPVRTDALTTEEARDEILRVFQK
ncbi:MAG: energy-coupling factor transporter ATPase [Lachnospiraceae bacterium]|nr:energy-coupling factor transporter ATPase [Lachnospiraceae bacterium]